MVEAMVLFLWRERVKNLLWIVSSILVVNQGSTIHNYMKYNHKFLSKRRRDYSSVWWHFFTVRAIDRKHYFGEIVDWKIDFEWSTKTYIIAEIMIIVCYHLWFQNLNHKTRQTECDSIQMTRQISRLSCTQ